MTTANYSIPQLASAQAQKHVTVNDGFNIIDSAMNLVAIRIDFTAPPGTPAEGDIYVPAATATGAWTGQENKVALYQNATWNFFTPKTGWRLYDQNASDLLIFNGAAWTGFGAALTSFSLVGINGATADATNVLSVAGPGTLFNQTTGSFTLTVNKAAAGDSGMLNFQTAFSTRAQIGNIGNSNFTIKTSANGSAFTDALIITAASGIATFADRIRSSLGTAALPNFSFNNDTDTGMFRIAANRLGFAANGAENLEVSGTQVITKTGDFLATNGGNSSRLKVNKAAVGDDASFELQSNFTTNASLGLLANNDFTIKVGASSLTAVVIANATGAVTLSEHSKFSGYLNFGQNYTAGAWQDMLINNLRHNDQADVALASNVATFTAPHDGYFFFGLGATWENGGTTPTKMQIGLRINTTDPTGDRLANTGDATFVSGETAVYMTALIKLTSGDTVKPRVQFTGANGRILADENYFWGAQIA